MNDEPMRNIMTNPHFVQFVSAVSVPWHSASWQWGHPQLNIQAHRNHAVGTACF